MTQELYSTALEIRMLMAMATKKAMHAFEQRLGAAGHGVSGLQYGIMRALGCHEMTITELSHRFMLDPSTLVPAVDALERRGFIERGRDPNDRRRVPLSLTESGAAFVQSVPHADDSDLLVQSLAEMSEPARQQLLSLLRDLVRHMPQGEDVLQRVASRVQTHMEHFS
jgi:DNA-binding MarR family transcriptional regulator